MVIRSFVSSSNLRSSPLTCAAAPLVGLDNGRVANLGPHTVQHLICGRLRILNLSTKYQLSMIHRNTEASKYHFSDQHRLDDGQPLLPQHVHGLVLVEGGPGLLDPGEGEGDAHLVEVGLQLPALAQLAHRHEQHRVWLHPLLLDHTRELFLW